MADEEIRRIMKENLAMQKLYGKLFDSIERSGGKLTEGMAG